MHPTTASRKRLRYNIHISSDSDLDSCGPPNKKRMLSPNRSSALHLSLPESHRLPLSAGFERPCMTSVAIWGQQCRRAFANTVIADRYMQDVCSAFEKYEKRKAFSLPLRCYTVSRLLTVWETCADV
jgi:hypothetical protein